MTSSPPLDIPQTSKPSKAVKKSSPAPICLILGAGPNIGTHLAKMFAANGYRIVIASRSPPLEICHLADVAMKTDFNDPENITVIFKETRNRLGHPSVVIYNACASTIMPANILSTPPERFANDITVNITSAYRAAHEAVYGFAKLPDSVLKTFIYTGNRLNIEPMPFMLSLSMGKVAVSHMIQAACLSYKADGYRFYYADERQASGAPIGSNLSAKGHAEFYYKLSQQKDQGPWQATFISGQGYVDFKGQ